MKRLMILIGVVLSIAACSGGGGSSSGGPVVVPPTNPPVTYTAKLMVVGGDMGTVTQSYGLRPESVSVMAASTPPPLQINSPDDNTGSPFAGGGLYSSGAQVTVTAQVSPQPPSVSSVSYTTDSPVIAIASPHPSPNPSASPADMIPYTGAGVTSVSVTDSGHSITGTVVSNGTPYSATLPAFVYQGHTLYNTKGTSGFSQPANEYSGYAVNNGALVPAADPAHAAIYFTSAVGSSPWNDSTDPIGTIHYPGGGVLLANNLVFAGLTASQWSNAGTSVGLSTVNTANPDHSRNNILLFRTTDQGTGSTVTVAWLFTTVATCNSSSLCYVNGPVKISGHSIDGF